MSVALSIPHDSARLHVTGVARYIDDIPTPAGTLHLCFGLSSEAAGRIETVDLSKVRAAPGVVMVLQAQDLDRPADVSPSVHDEPLLAGEEVHYIGQPLFLVVATSHLSARYAARLAEIRINTQPPILSIDDALKAKSWFEGGPITYVRGEVNKAITAAAHRIDGSIEIGGQEHFYLEGQAAIAFPQEDGDMLVHSSTQHPSEIQHKVAEALGHPMHAVRVEARRMGGGFGGKESQGNALAVACAIAADKTGCPCKMRYDRDDDMLITGKRHDFRIDYRAGFNDKGRIQGLAFTQYARCGWSQDLSLPVCDRAMLHADNAYFLPDVSITSYRLRTNTQSATAFRGFGGPQGMVGIERVMDHIAHHLGRDPLDVRRRNYYRASDAPVHQTTPYGQPVEDFILHEMTDRLVTSADYHARREQLHQWNQDNPVIKRGIAITPVKFGISFTLTHLNQAGALVHVYSDGSVQINHGGTEMGQGLFQKVAQVAATQFGLSMDAIRIMATDTAKVPNTSATAASSGSDLNGMAVKNACEMIRARMACFIAEREGGTPGAVRFHEGHVHVGSKSFAFNEIAQRAYENRISLSSTGFYKTPKVAWDRIRGKGRPFFYFAYGLAASEVALDTLTGENRLLRVDILHDAGSSLNPALDIGQIEGGFIQGAGWLTTEELVWNEKGVLSTHAPSTYKIPACGDRPDVFNVALWEGPNREETIYRSKAVGEPPLMLGISALAALSDAVAACGPSYPDLHAPATPEQLLNAITCAKGGRDV